MYYYKISQRVITGYSILEKWKIQSLFFRLLNFNTVSYQVHWLQWRTAANDMAEVCISSARPHKQGRRQRAQDRHGKDYKAVGAVWHKAQFTPQILVILLTITKSIIFIHDEYTFLFLCVTEKRQGDMFIVHKQPVKGFQWMTQMRSGQNGTKKT